MPSSVHGKSISSLRHSLPGRASLSTWASCLVLATAWLAHGSEATAAPGFVPHAVATTLNGPVDKVALPTLTPDFAEDLRKRQRGGGGDGDVDGNDGEDESTSSSAPPETTTTQSTESTSQSSTIILSITPPTGTSSDLPTALPTPFDSAMASSFTGGDSSCPNFIKNLIESSDYKRCYPISMLLLHGSQSWFEAGKNLVTIVRALDAGCDADVDFCKEYLAGAARDLLQDENCGAEYDKSHKVVLEAYMGLTAYDMVYAATCLQDPESSMYCYATAATNRTTPSNLYPYYLPLNNQFPASSVPTCNWCLQETMGIFQAASENRNQPISNTYEAAARQINVVCGPEFVNETLPEAREGLAGKRTPSLAVIMTAAALAMGFGLL